MLTKIEVRTSKGDVLNLPIYDSTEGYLVQDVQGLDPVLAVMVSSPYAARDGEQFQSSRRERRNIILTLGAESNYRTNTIQGLRNRLYGFFMPKSEILLRFVSDDVPTMEIKGLVESFEWPLFTKDPMVTISILCFNPDFYNPTAVVLNSNTVSNETEYTFSYSGSVNTGFLLTFNINRTITEFDIFNRGPDGTVESMSFASPLQANDVLKISTESGNKYATLTRLSTDQSILYGLSPESKWLELKPGSNHIRVYAEGAAIPYSIRYTNKYGGL